MGNPKYDAVVVGASIAGLYAAIRLAEAGWCVAVYDRRSAIGLPVRCGEATGNRTELRRFVAIDESYIACDLTGLTVHLNEAAPLGKDIPDCGVILNRDRFEQHLAFRAQKAGAVIVLNTYVKGLVKDNGAFAGILLEDGGRVEAGIIIGADGCESSVGRWAGMVKPLRISEAYTSCQYTITQSGRADNHMHFYVGSQTIPNGYIWVFPKSDTTLSVGAGLYGAHPQAEKAVDILHGFLANHFPDALRSNFITGCAPQVCPRKLTKDNIVLIGDAARQVNPLTAGGIMNALEATELAMDSLIAAGKGLERPEKLLAYSRKWSGGRPRLDQKLFAIFKEIFVSLSDAEIEKTMRVAGTLFSGSMMRDRPFKVPVFRAGAVFMLFLGKFMKHWRMLFV